MFLISYDINTIYILILGGDEVTTFVFIADAIATYKSLMIGESRETFKVSQISQEARWIIVAFFVENVGVTDYASRRQLMYAYTNYRFKLGLNTIKIDQNSFDRYLEELLCGGIIASHNMNIKKPWNYASSPDQVRSIILNILKFVMVTI